MIRLHLDPRYSVEEEIERETEGKREGGRERERAREEGRRGKEKGGKHGELLNLWVRIQCMRRLSDSPYTNY